MFGRFSALSEVVEWSCDLLQPSRGKVWLSKPEAPGQLSGAGAARQSMGGLEKAFRSSSAGLERPGAGLARSWRAPWQALGALTRPWAGVAELLGRPGAALGRL